MSVTVGEFLRTKLSNMGEWISSELGGELSLDIKQYISERTDTQIVCVANILSTHSSMIAHRDWQKLGSMSDIPAELMDVFQLIRKREGMHDKFWRYLHMFAEVMK